MLRIRIFEEELSLEASSTGKIYPGHVLSFHARRVGEATCKVVQNFAKATYDNRDHPSQCSLAV